MKIAQISPLFESVPPKMYGGTERVVHYLTEELVAQGHDVTLFASGDSVTSARLISAHPSSLRLDPSSVDQIAPHIAMIEKVEKMAEEFDVIHSHIDYLYYPLMRRNPKKNYISTLHGRLDTPELLPLYHEYADIPLVSISDAQRKPLSFANWMATVYHGLPLKLLKPNPVAGNYLAFLGRISPEKRVDRAIEVAVKTGIPLKIAAKISKADQEYFQGKIRPLMDHPLVEFVGEINEHEKQEFLGNALGLLLLIDWPEPFGLVMIEAMACATPVIAYGLGSVPEIIDHGITGFIVNSQQEAIARVEQLQGLGRQQVRRVFEQRFPAARMASDYVAVYQSLQQQAGLYLPSYQLNGKSAMVTLANTGYYGTKISR